MPETAETRPYRGLKVFLSTPGKSLFQTLNQFELDLRQGLPPDDLEAGLVVFAYPFSDKPQFISEQFAQLSSRWRGRLAQAGANGTVKIVLDSSPEGSRHSARRTNAIHEGLRLLGPTPPKVVLITQEKNCADEYRQYCRRHGLPEWVRVASYDYWIKRFHAQFEENAQRILKRRQNAFRSRAPRRSRRFVSLNLTARRTKLLFLLSLLRDGLWDEGHVSFGGFDKKASAFNPDHITQQTAETFEGWLTDFRGFEDLGRELAPFLPQLKAKGRILFGQLDQAPDGALTKTPLYPHFAEYDDSWFSVITETEMRDRPSRITEKPFKSLVSFHPLIVFGNPGALAALRGLGYRTFSGIIDESYDQVDEPRRRFEMAYQEFRRLCALDGSELHTMEQKLSRTLHYNARWGMLDLPRIYREQLDAKLLDEVLTA
jgi:hypothetical protein